MTKKDQSNIEVGDMVVFRKPKSYILMGRVFEVVSVNEEGFYELMSSFGWSVPAAGYEIMKYPAEINDTSYLDRIGFTKDKLTGECSFIWEKTEQGHDYWLKFFTGQMSDIEARAAQWVIDFLEEKYADELSEGCMMSNDPLEDAWKELEAIGQENKRTAQESAKDIQIGGSHYKDFTIQPVEFILANNLGFCEGNIVKYACRYKQKGGVEDLEKVIHYAQLLIEDLKAE